MQYDKIITLALACGISASVYAADSFELGKVQVAGKELQSDNLLQNNRNMEFGKIDNSIPTPDVTPEIESLSYKPITEKPSSYNIHKGIKNEFSAALGVGNLGSSEMLINGKVQNDKNTSDLLILRQSKDAFKSKVETERTGIKAKIVPNTVDNTTVMGGFEMFEEVTALRGTDLSISTGNDANAKLDNDNKRIWINSDSTLENGASAKGYVTIDALNRDVTNDAGFRDKQNVKAYRIGGTYKNRIDTKTNANASIDIRKEDFESSLGNDFDFTKLTAAAGIEREMSSKTVGGFGLKVMQLKSEDKISPYFNFSYQPDSSWKLSLGYEEDLGNDDIEKIFMPNRYVDSNDFRFRASKKKTMKSSLDYQTPEGDSIGIDLFAQKEDNSIEYYDVDNYQNKKILSSCIGYADAERKGLTLRGDFKIDECFSLIVKATAQTPEDRNGNRLSYEPERILDVGLAYSNGKIMLDFTRRAESERKAYIGTYGNPLRLVDVSDYNRSDLAVKYKLNDRFTGYIKIKDLYDEGKIIRNNVSEEGRITLGGIEFHF